ncbi:methyltransferase domain-containing protein [Nibricoccus sp. IMCC34717]|uniref:methyltransferase domain-containing protein n=1 Tax=Nibricoccus sp. IMCC34717 TaxID=3034021 RepID=UPI0038509F90
MGNASFLHAVDAPRILPGGRWFRTHGWVGGPEAAWAKGSVFLEDAKGQRSEPIPLEARPDVAAVHPQLHFIGFHGVMSARWLADGLLRFVAIAGDVEYRFMHKPQFGADAEAKQQKLARIRPLLRDDMAFIEAPYAFDFLDEALAAEFSITETDAISSHGYDPLALDLITGVRDGLVLDCGAGCRSDTQPNVVNFEIAPYPSTDVIGVGEKLPFVDNAFDGVITLNVLEHVKDPFRCAAEILRVLKPGGRVYAVVPFLQPYHAYPHHYYNMTHQGLANVFGPGLKIEAQEAPLSGHPIFTLEWFLKRYAAGLPAAEAEKFKGMTVAQLMESADEQMRAPHAALLDFESRLHLASTTMLFGTKR